MSVKDMLKFWDENPDQFSAIEWITKKMEYEGPTEKT